MTPIKDVVKSQIEDADAIFDKDIKIVYSWLQDQVDNLAMKSVVEFKDFINSIPDIINDDDRTKDVILNERYIYKDNDFNVKYYYSISNMLVTIKTTIPLNVERAFKACQLVDRKKTEETLKDFEFIIYIRGKELINTTFSFTRSTYGYMSERTYFELSEDPVTALALN